MFGIPLGIKCPTAVPKTPCAFYPSDFNYFIILGISSDGINAIVTHKGAMPPPPPIDWRVKQKKKEKGKEKKSQQEDLNSHPENKQCNAVQHVV